MTSTETLSGWGRLRAKGRQIVSEDLEHASEGAVLCRGLGRSYGDSAIPPPSRPVVLTTTLADRILTFDPTTGVLRAEAGMSIAQLNQRLLPYGFFVPVTPGTQFVTLGGAVAADVHGKNHHVDGCFGEHVRGLRMRLADGEIVSTSPAELPDLFWATVGGMGLTGHILEVELALRRVRSSWIRQHTERIDDIDAFVDALRRAARTSPFTVGWIDCLSRGAAMGRGILIAGDWADPADAPDLARDAGPLGRIDLPIELPGFFLSRPVVRAFNAAYYWKHLPRTRSGIAHWETFFYPLDRIRHWNRMYGPRGFTQYQCVLPEKAGPSAVRRLLDVLTRRGGASFLCVIKDCGPEGHGLLSFPMQGTSIAFDIPMRDDTQALVDALNERVIAEGGRIYLAKDSFTRPEHFRAMDPRLSRFLEVRRRWDPEGRIKSAQSVRLFGDEA
ncbi:putative oxidoreductase [Minicystis rosea]|nr:putative oxidoreductase [Minicystis rosea]